MTLLVRLLIVAVLGVGVFFGYVLVGEPKLRAMMASDAAAQTQSGGQTQAQAPLIKSIGELFGEYHASATAGRYVLVLDSTAAVMRYTDKQGHEYAYRGHYTVDGSSLVVEWAEQRNAGRWEGMTGVADRMTIVSLDAINAPERAFKRVKAKRAT